MTGIVGLGIEQEIKEAERVGPESPRDAHAEGRNFSSNTFRSASLGL